MSERGIVTRPAQNKGYKKWSHQHPSFRFLSGLRRGLMIGNYHWSRGTIGEAAGLLEPVAALPRGRESAG